MFSDAPTVSPSGSDFYGDTFGQALTVKYIDRIVGNYTAAAREARRAGFDGIEIHGARGYLSDLFFWDHTNRRADSYPAFAA
jgi:2,4-dienoyl-CoA reductase-like NADH-dependent reductase (Old Yellow Enzyme family)